MFSLSSSQKIIFIALPLLAGLLFFAAAEPIFAADCYENTKRPYFSFLAPLLSLAEKMVKNFGYEVSLAAAPDPDFCGNDSVRCVGSTPTATINWVAPTPGIAPCTGPYPYWCGGIIQSCVSLSYYLVTVPGVSGSPFNTGSTNSLTKSSGLADNTTYNWSVEHYFYYNQWFSSLSSVSCGYSNQPYGAFTTLNCAPPPPPPPPTTPTPTPTPTPAPTPAPTLSVSLTANPSSGAAPLNNVVLTADVSGSAVGTINYTFYCNRSDSGTNITSGWAHKLDGTNLDPYSAPAGVCNSVYAAAGTYTAKVIAERGGLAAEARRTVTVYAPPTVSLTANGIRPQIKIAEGWSVNLNWTSSNANSCTGLVTTPNGQLDGAAGWNGPKPTSDSSPAYTYTLTDENIYTFTTTCTGPGGSAQSSVMVDVIASELTLERGSQICDLVNLSWSWNDPWFNNEFDQYRVLRSDDNLAFSQRALVNAPTMTYQDQDAFISDKIYYYKIEALKSGQPSTFSNTIETTPCPKLPSWQEVRPR